MFDFIDKLVAAGYSLAIHAVVLILLVFSMDMPIKPLDPQPVSDNDIIRAVAIDESRIEREIEKLKALDRKKHQAEEQHQAKLKRAADAARKAREKEQQQLARLKKKQQAERDAAQRKVVQEEQRLAEIQQRRETESRRLVEIQQRQMDTEARRRSEERQLAMIEATKRQEIEAMRRIEIERRALEADKQRLEQEKQRQLAELALRDELAAEQTRTQARQEAAARRELDKYTSIIKQKIENSWRLSNTRKGLSCDLYVRVIPGGDVAEARVVRSSGDAAFDRSAETAVFKSSPLPMPSEPGLFERLREIRFRFDPTG